MLLDRLLTTSSFILSQVGLTTLLLHLLSWASIAAAMVQLVENQVSDRKLLTPGSIPALAICRCVFGKESKDT